MTHPLRTLFAPESLALVGASEREGSVGRAVLDNLRAGGFRGPIHYVNPRHKTLVGQACLSSLSKLPGPVDLAVICAPAPVVPAIVTEAGRSGVRSVVVLSAGFAETDAAGAELQHETAAAAREARIRLLGPNCVGILRPAIGLNASFARSGASPGGIALVSQSGAICTALVDWAAAVNVGLSSVVSLGAAADVDFGDILDYLLFDPLTRSVLLYVEGVHHGRRFVGALRALARAKPVVALKVGRFAAGSNAARSHTGALVGDDAVFDAVLRRCGVVRVEGYTSLFAAARALAMNLKPGGDRLAIVTNGGGPGALAADAAVEEGLAMATLAPETLAALGAILPKHWSHGNPVDVIGDAGGARFAGAVTALLKDPGVDMIVSAYAPTGISSAQEVADALIPVAHEASKPVLTAWLGEAGVVDVRHKVDEAGVPAYPAAEVAVKAAAVAAHWVRNQRLLLEAPPARTEGEEPDLGPAHARLRHAMNRGRTLLDEVESKTLLGTFGLRVPAFAIAHSREQAVGEAAILGYPIALKILSPDITHKSDVNGVRLSIRDAEILGHEYDSLLADVARLRPEARIEGVVVQRMVPTRNGRELFVGVSTDPVFGPVIAFGSGGVAVELLKDHAVALPPLNALLAADLVDRTRAAKLLGAYRNVPAAKREALIEVLLRVSDLVCALPWVKEMDLNPLLLGPEGATVLDARVVVDPASRMRDATWSHLTIHPYPVDLERDEHLRDGTAVRLRPIRPEDSVMETAFITALSEESRYRRFLTLVRHVTPEMVARFTQIDYDREMALIAVSRDESGTEAIVGVARYVREPDPTAAEFAVVVADKWQGLGLATRLMERLMDCGRKAGLVQLHGTVLASNAPMRALMNSLGFEIRPIPDDHQVVEAFTFL